MAKLIIIAAVGSNRELGIHNDLVWKIKEDLAFFKVTTLDHKIVMGYHTYLSLPKKLARREEIVLTSHGIDGINTFSDFKELLDYLNTLEETVYIIGGASIYQLFLPYVEELLLTEVELSCKEADTYFPEFKKEDYEFEILKEVKEDISYRRIRYKKRGE